MKTLLCLLMGVVLLALTGCAAPTSGSSANQLSTAGTSAAYTQASVHEWPEWGEAGETGFSGMVDYRAVLSDPGPF